MVARLAVKEDRLRIVQVGSGTPPEGSHKSLCHSGDRARLRGLLVLDTYFQGQGMRG